MGAMQPRARGTLEREILTCLAAATHPMTAAQVQAEIGGGLAYTTVMTTLSRLHAKNALVRGVAGRAYEYSLQSSLQGGTAGAQSNMTAHQMLKLLDEESDRAGVLSRFVAQLKPADEQLLVDLLERAAEPAAPPSRRAPGGRRPKRTDP